MPTFFINLELYDKSEPNFPCDEPACFHDVCYMYFGILIGVNGCSIFSSPYFREHSGMA